MYTMHLNQTPLVSQRMLIASDALLQNIVVPGTSSILTAENELDGGIEKLEGFRPLVRFFGVILFGELFHLPVAPAFVAESPVFDLSWC